MDRERLTRLLEEPGRVAREDLSDLKALTERYPWFSGAQLLRVAGEQAGGDVLFNETLKSATAHLPSRAVLFDLVEQRDHQPPVQPRPEPRILRLPVQETRPAVHTEPVAPETAQEEAPTVEEAEDTIGPKPGETEKPTVTTEGAEDPLERQIVEAALATAYDLTWKDETRLPRPAAGGELGQKPQRQATPIPAPVPDPSPAAKAARVPSGPTLKETIDPSSRLSFTAWLSAAYPAEGTEPPTPTPSATPPDAQDWLRSDPVAKAQISTADTRELIDRFIQQQMPEPTHKAEFFTPQQAAKRSLDDTAGLVTETLARIYEKQGNLPKAIEAYRRLALKYPHKSGYFAALQKSLEEQLNK